MSVDSAAVPSVRARLAELKLQHSSDPSPPARPPTRAKPPPPPPPSRAPSTVPPLPARRTQTAPPAKAGVRPPPPPPAVASKPPPPKPPLPNRSASGRTLPPAFTSIADLPPLPPRSIPPLPPRKPTPALPTRAQPPLPTRKTEPQLPTQNAPRRRLPPITAPPPLPPPTPSAPPPIPAASRPPPVPRSSRPDPTTLTHIPTTTCLHHRDFTAPDTLAASPDLHRTRVPSLSSLAHSLTSPFPSHTDKARALFTWCHHNIAYDIVGLDTNRKGAQDASSVLQSGLSVCQGYAEIYLELARLAGVECKLVSGHGKGAGYNPAKKVAWPPSGHAWNAVRIDGGVWWLVDACWGAGHVGGGPPRAYTKKFNPRMFTDTPYEFGRRHFATDGRWNLGGWEWEGYAAPEVQGVTVYNCFKDEGWNSDEGVLERRLRRGRQRVVLTWGKCEHMDVPREVPLMIATTGDKIEKGNTVAFERVGEREWAADVEVGMECKAVMVYKVTKFRDGDGMGLSGAEFLNGLGRYGMAWGGMLRWDGIDG